MLSTSQKPIKNRNASSVKKFNEQPSCGKKMQRRFPYYILNSGFSRTNVFCLTIEQYGKFASKNTIINNTKINYLRSEKKLITKHISERFFFLEIDQNNAKKYSSYSGILKLKNNN